MSFRSKSLNEQISELSKGITGFLKAYFYRDGNDKSTLEYISYKLEKPKFDVIECKQRSLSYSAALKAILRLGYDMNTENNIEQILPQKNKYLSEIFH